MINVPKLSLATRSCVMLHGVMNRIFSLMTLWMFLTSVYTGDVYLKCGTGLDKPAVPGSPSFTDVSIAWLRYAQHQGVLDAGSPTSKHLDAEAPHQNIKVGIEVPSKVQKETLNRPLRSLPRLSSPTAGHSSHRTQPHPHPLQDRTTKAGLSIRSQATSNTHTERTSRTSPPLIRPNTPRHEGLCYLRLHSGSCVSPSPSRASLEYLRLRFRPKTCSPTAALHRTLRQLPFLVRCLSPALLILRSNSFSLAQRLSPSSCSAYH